MENKWLHTEESSNEAIYEFIGSKFDTDIYPLLLKSFPISLSKCEHINRKEECCYEPSIILSDEIIAQLYIMTCQFIRYPLFYPNILKNYDDPIKIMKHTTPSEYSIIRQIDGIFKPLTEDYIKEALLRWEENVSKAKINEIVKELFPYMEIENYIINKQRSSIIMYDASNNSINCNYVNQKPYIGLYNIFEVMKQEYHNNQTIINNLDGLISTKNIMKCITDSVFGYADNIYDDCGYHPFGGSIRYNSAILTDFYGSNSIILQINSWLDIDTIDEDSCISCIALSTNDFYYYVNYMFKDNNYDESSDEKFAEIPKHETCYILTNKVGYYYLRTVMIEKSIKNEDMENIINEYILSDFKKRFDEYQLTKDVELVDVDIHEEEVDSSFDSSNNNDDINNKDIQPTEIFDIFFQEALDKNFETKDALEYAKAKSKEFFDGKKE